MIESISRERWERAQEGESHHYDYQNRENYKHAATIILRDHFNVDMDKDLVGKKILESGGGCYPAVYFCKGLKKAVNVEPLYYQFPDDIKSLMNDSGIESCSVGFEDFLQEDQLISEEEKFDEVWFFNVLQHVRDPYLQIENAKKISKIIRLFEPIETAINNEHPHSFTIEFFREQFPNTEVSRYRGGSVGRFHGADCAYLIWSNTGNG